MSWEDDDFEVPTLNVAAIAQSNDDEEDLLLVEKREAAKRLASGELLFLFIHVLFIIYFTFIINRSNARTNSSNGKESRRGCN